MQTHEEPTDPYLLMRILFVDDEKNFLALLKQGLTQDPELALWDLHFAESALQARQLLELYTPIDIVVTDFHMPREDGLSLAQHISQTYPQTRVIILSSYSDALAGLPYELIQKPISLAGLKTLLKYGQD